MRPPIIGLVTGLVVFLAGSMAWAQNPGRVLNGHRFIPSEQIPTPFVTSYIKTATGGGAAFDLKTPFLDVNGDTLGTLEGNVAFMNLAFQYQQKVTDWLALRGGFTGSARVGIDEQSMLAQGLTGIVGWSLGGSALIVHQPKWLLSGSLDFGRNDFIGLDPFGFAQTVIDSGGLSDDNNLVSSTNSVSGRAMVRAAWAPKRWLGATAILEGGVGDVQDFNSKGIFGAAATLGVDFRQLNWWSLGVLGFFRYETFNQNGTDLTSNTSRVGLGVSYTGRDDFSVGLEGSSITAAQEGSDDPFTGLLVTFNIRYWFSGG
jgi:hypothetical protein